VQISSEHSTRRADMENQSSQKQERIGKTRKALRTIRGFVDRCLTARTVVVVTILLLVASWIYSPWIHYGRYRERNTPEVAHGWFFVFDTTQKEGSDSEIVMRIDFGRLLLIDAVIALVGGLSARAAFHNSKAVQLAFYSLLTAFLISGVLFASSPNSASLPLLS
jgi:hypothetical protein